MRDYELLYILPGDKPESDTTKLSDEVNAWLTKHGGKPSNQDDWGRRKLAYPIDKQDHGWYVITRFTIEPGKLDEFRRGLDLNAGILRTMVVSADELPTEEELAKLEEAAKDKEKEKEPAKPEPKAEATPPTVKKVEPKKPAKAEKPAEEKKPETAEEKKKRQAALDEKLGEILKDEEEST